MLIKNKHTLMLMTMLCVAIFLLKCKAFIVELLLPHSKSFKTSELPVHIKALKKNRKIYSSCLDLQLHISWSRYPGH